MIQPLDIATRVRDEGPHMLAATTFYSLALMMAANAAQPGCTNTLGEPRYDLAEVCMDLALFNAGMGL